MHASDFNRFFLITALALLVNLLLFAGLPNFLKNDFPETDVENMQVVQFLGDTPHRNQHLQEKNALEKPLPKELPRIIPTKRPESIQPQRPEQLKMEMPDLDFDVRPDMNSGIPIIPPRSKPTVPQLSAQVVTMTGPPLKEVYGSKEVDQIPVATMKTTPAYPYRARRLNLNGKVDVRFLVDRAGRVSQVSIPHSDPPNLFDQSVLTAVSSWRFEPGKVRGSAVATWVTTTIIFRIEDL